MSGRREKGLLSDPGSAITSREVEGESKRAKVIEGMRKKKKKAVGFKQSPANPRYRLQRFNVTGTNQEPGRV